MDEEIVICNLVQFDYRKISCKDFFGQYLTNKTVSQAIACYLEIDEHADNIFIYSLEKTHKNLHKIETKHDITSNTIIVVFDLYNLGISSLTKEYLRNNGHSSAYEALKLFNIVNDIIIPVANDFCTELCLMTENFLRNQFFNDNILNYVKNRNEPLSSCELIQDQDFSSISQQDGWKILDNIIFTSEKLTYQLCKALIEEQKIYQAVNEQVLKKDQAHTVSISENEAIEIPSDILKTICDFNPVNEKEKEITKNLIYLGGGSFGKAFRFIPFLYEEPLIIKHNISLEKGFESKKPAWYREFHHTRNLKHENVINYLGQPVIYCRKVFNIMEDGGQSLISIYFKNRSMANKDIITAMHNVASGMNHLHKNKIVHRDIRCDNITYREQSGLYKIIDFGMSSETTIENSKFVSKVESWGNPYWMSPELLRLRHKKEGKGNNKSDIWSYGVVVLEMLSFPVRPDHVTTYHGIEYQETYSKKVINDQDNPMRYWHDEWRDDIKDLLLKCFLHDCLKRIDSNELLNNVSRLPCDYTHTNQ